MRGLGITVKQYIVGIERGREKECERGGGGDREGMKWVEEEREAKRENERERSKSEDS